MASAQNPKIFTMISMKIVLGRLNIITQELAGTFYSNLHRGLTHSPHSSHFTAVGKQVRAYWPPTQHILVLTSIWDMCKLSGTSEKLPCANFHLKGLYLIAWK